MATMIGRGAGGKRLDLDVRPLVFQRSPRSAAEPRNRKRVALRFRHVLGLLALAVAFFLALGRIYLFVASWDRLTIRTFEFHGGSAGVRRTLNATLSSRPLGNILFCDLAVLQGRLKSCPWVREARVQKVFPSSLKIEITERTPFALLEKNGLALLAEDGTVLEPSAAADAWPLPVVRDEGAFAGRFEEKWEAARACLEALSPAERARLASVECADDGRLTLTFRDDALRLVLDGTVVREKLDLVAVRRKEWESRFGALDTVDLRFDGRVILRPIEPQPQLQAEAGSQTAKSQKEAE